MQRKGTEGHFKWGQGPMRQSGLKGVLETEILIGIYRLMNLQPPIARLVILTQWENNYLDIQDNYFVKEKKKKRKTRCLPFYTLFSAYC